MEAEHNPNVSTKLELCQKRIKKVDDNEGMTTEYSSEGDKREASTGYVGPLAHPDELHIGARGYSGPLAHPDELHTGARCRTRAKRRYTSRDCCGTENQENSSSTSSQSEAALGEGNNNVCSNRSQISQSVRAKVPSGKKQNKKKQKIKNINTNDTDDVPNNKIDEEQLTEKLMAQMNVILDMHMKVMVEQFDIKMKHVMYEANEELRKTNEKIEQMTFQLEIIKSTTASQAHTAQLSSNPDVDGRSRLKKSGEFVRKKIMRKGTKLRWLTTDSDKGYQTGSTSGDHPLPLSAMRSELHSNSDLPTVLQRAEARKRATTQPSNIDTDLSSSEIESHHRLNNERLIATKCEENRASGRWRRTRRWFSRLSGNELEKVANRSTLRIDRVVHMSWTFTSFNLCMVFFSVTCYLLYLLFKW